MEKCFIMIDRTNTVHVHNEMLIHYREKWNHDIYRKLRRNEKHCVKQNESDSKGQICHIS